MGYTTYFEGSISVDGRVEEELACKINDFCEERHEEENSIGFYCDWMFDKESNSIIWNDSEKFYKSAEWLKYIIDTFLAPKGFICNGEINCDGEQSDDNWRIIVRDNKVFTSIAEMVYQKEVEVEPLVTINKISREDKIEELVSNVDSWDNNTLIEFAKDVLRGDYKVIPDEDIDKQYLEATEE